MPLLIYYDELYMLHPYMYGKATFIKVNQLRYDSLSQKYQGTSVQVLIAFNGIVFLLVKL